MPRAPRLHLNEDRQEAFLGGSRVELTTVQFRILLALKKSNKIMSRMALLERVWDSDESFDKDTRTIDQHVSRLRRRLARHAKKAPLIETVLNVGYKYIGS